MLKITTPHNTAGQKPSRYNKFIPIALFITTMGAFFSILQISLPLTINIFPPTESLKILVNHLFTISEQYQAYLYQHFIVSVLPHNYENYIFSALMAVAIFLAALIIAARRYKFVYAIIFFAFTTLQIYFGIFAAPLWNIALYAVIAWAVLRDVSIAFLGSAVVVAAIVTLLIFPGTNPFLTELSETIRDQFGRQQERHIVMGAIPQEPALQQESTALQIGDADDSQAGSHEIYIRRDDIFAGSQIGTAFGQRLWLLWLIGLAFAAGFVLWFLHKLLAAYKRQLLFKSPDGRVAIDAMFRYMIACVLAFTPLPKNSAYSRYAAVFPQGAGYLSALDIWQKATYSDHAITEGDRQQMHGTLDETIVFLLSDKRPVARTFTRIRLFLSTQKSISNSDGE